MDVFLEHLVKHKKTTKDKVIIGLIIFAGIILTFVILLLSVMFGQIGFTFGLLIIAAIWYGAYLLIQMRNIEYEYILTNYELDIDKIINKNGRKRVITINFKEIDICANKNDSLYQNNLKNTQAIEQTMDLSGDIDDDNVYFVDFHFDSKRTRVFFQPTQKIIDAIHKLNPRNVHI